MAVMSVVAAVVVVVWVAIEQSHLMGTKLFSHVVLPALNHEGVKKPRQGRRDTMSDTTTSDNEFDYASSAAEEEFDLDEFKKAEERNEELFNQKLFELIKKCKERGLQRSHDEIKAEIDKLKMKSRQGAGDKKKKKKDPTPPCLPKTPWFLKEDVLRKHDRFIGKTAYDSYISNYCEDVDDIGTLNVGDMLVYIGDLGAEKKEKKSLCEIDEDEDESEEEDIEETRVYVAVKSIIIGLTKPRRARKPRNMILLDPHSNETTKVSFNQKDIARHYFKSKNIELKDFIGSECADVVHFLRTAQHKHISGAIEKPLSASATSSSTKLIKVFSTFDD